jgi:hypothetical protein
MVDFIRAMIDREGEDIRETIGREGEGIIISSRISSTVKEDIHLTTFKMNFQSRRHQMVIGMAVLTVSNSNSIVVDIHLTASSKTLLPHRLLMAIGVVAAEGEDTSVGGEGLLQVEDLEEEVIGDGIKVGFETKNFIP